MGFPMPSTDFSVRVAIGFAMLAENDSISTSQTSLEFAKNLFKNNSELVWTRPGGVERAPSNSEDLHQYSVRCDQANP